MTIELQALSSLEVFHVIRRLKPQIEESLNYDGGAGNFVTLADNLLSGRETFWIANEGKKFAWAVGRTQHRASDSAFLYVVWLGGGDLEVIKQAIPLLEEWAQQEGYSELRFRGRRGWQRVLGSQGYVNGAVTMCKNLEKIDG